MATTTTSLDLRKPAGGDTVNVATDLNAPYDIIDGMHLKGADVTSAATLEIGGEEDGNFRDVTGTDTVTAISTRNAGQVIYLQFDGVLTLTYNATSLILPTDANIATVAGDIASFVSLGSGNWLCLWYQRQTGVPLVLGADSVDAITEIAAALKSGSDGTLVTGTAGTNGDLSQWNGDGDLVDGPTPPSGTIVGTSDTQTLTNKTISGGTFSGTIAGTPTYSAKQSISAQDALDLTHASGGFITATQAQIDMRTGGANPVRINAQTGGTGGFEVWDGAGSPAKVFDVDGSGNVVAAGTLTDTTGLMKSTHSVFTPPTQTVGGTTAVDQVVGGGRHAATSLGNASSDGSTHINFVIPTEFAAVTKLVVVCMAVETGNLRWGVYTAYAADGEAHTANNASIADATLAVTAGQIFDLDISGGFSGLAAGDRCAISLHRAGSHGDDTITTFYVLGLLLEY